MKTKTMTFKGVRFGREVRDGEGGTVPEKPFEMTCIVEKPGLAVAPDGLHCWTLFLDGRWRYPFYEPNYRLDSIEEG
jgi:hypothetical protein